MTEATAKPARRWVWPALIVSLALNLAVIGLAAGMFWKHPHGGPRGMKHERVAGGMEAFVDEMPAGRRDAARARIKQYRDETAVLSEKVQELRKQIREELVAENYDEAKLRATLELMRAARAELGRSMGEAALDLVRDLTPEQRKKFLEIMKSRMRGRHAEGKPDKDK
ncbi:MAG: periplasmic heavy metal sensor [Pseudomonadota bacterium]|nr:periplasmic heavy metal sensor [Pseudomonadota bacterium]